MKHLTQLAVAGAAALVLSMSIGATSASATEFCSTNTSPCTGTIYGPGTKFTAQLKPLTTLKITLALGEFSSTITCRRSTMAGEITKGGAGKVSTVTFQECLGPNGSACALTVLSLPWTFTAEAGEGTSFSLPFSGSSGGAGVRFECGSLVNCSFRASPLTFSGVGGSPALLTAAGLPLSMEGGICWEKASLDAEYEVTAPKPLYVV
jgi:hypothetical protein